MQKNILIGLILTCILYCSSSYGQQVYQLNDYGKPGDIYLYNRFSGIQNTEVLHSGPDVTWDLSSNTNLNTHVSQIITKDQGIDQSTFLGICSLSAHSIFDCLNIWNNTDQALLIPDTVQFFTLTLKNLQRYQNLTTNRLLENFIGFTTLLGGLPTKAALVYQTPDTILNFPVTYGHQWTSKVKWSIDLSPTGQNIAYSSKQNRSTSVDSWGTLKTPYDTFENVIRIRSEIMRDDTLFTDSTTVPVHLTQVEYMWFDTNYTLPIMTANGIATDSTDNISAYQYIYNSTCAVPTWTVDSDQDTFYIDNTGSVTVHFVITGSNANEYQWDFGDGTFENSTGDISHTYTEAGSYSIGITGCMTNCLPLNSCSFGIVDFEIIDSLSSVAIIPGDEIGIKLYPNPVSHSFNVMIPAELGIQQYQILNISGRQVESGVLKPGTTLMTSDQLENGVYTIRMWNKEKKRNQVAILSLCVIQ